MFALMAFSIGQISNNDRWRVDAMKYNRAIVVLPISWYSSS